MTTDFLLVRATSIECMEMIEANFGREHTAVLLCNKEATGRSQAHQHVPVIQGNAQRFLGITKSPSSKRILGSLEK